MIRRFMLVCFSGVLAFAGSVPFAAAQDVDRPELWNESRLAPTATPAPEVVERSDDGIGAGALIALVAGAGVVGGLAGRLASQRRSRSREARPAPHAAPVTSPEPSPADRSPVAPSDRFMRDTPHRVRVTATVAGPPQRTQGPVARSASPAPAPRAPDPPPAASPRRDAPRRDDLPAAQPARAPGVSAGMGQARWNTCRVKLHSRSSLSYFYAVPYEGGPVLARSPSFRPRPRAGEPGLDAPAALRALVHDLTAAGWVRTRTGAVPWDLRFEHPPERQPAPPDHPR